MFVIYPARRLTTLMVGMRETALEPKRCRLIFSRCDSAGMFVLAEGCKGGGEELKIVPPLFIYNEQGIYTEEMQEIFNELSRFPQSGGG